MGVEIAEGVVKVTADSGDLSREVADSIRRNQGPFSGAGDESAKSFGSVFKGSFFGNFLGSIATDIVGQIGYAIGSGIRSAVEFGIQGIDIASGVVEAGTAIDSLFGSGAGTIKAFAEGAAQDIGQSELAALKAAQTFGVYGKAAGLADGELAGFSTNLQGLSSDFASFFDTSPEEAVLAIGAALRGEYEPIRQYGVILDEAALKNQAMAMGIYDGNGSLTAQQKILAANSAIFGQAGAALGDFDKTSGSLANQQRTLAAELENSQGALGEALLPAMLQLTSFANETLVPILNDVIEVVGPLLADALEDAAPAFLEMLDTVVPLIPEMVKLGTEALPGIITGIGDIIAFGAGFVTFFDEAGAAGNRLSEGIRTFFADVVARFQEGGAQIGAFFGAIGQWFQDVANRLAEGQAQVFGFFGAVGARFAEGGAQIGAFFTAIGAWFADMGGRFATGWAQISGFFGNVGGAIAHGIGEFGRFAGEVGANIGRAVGFVGSLPGRAMAAVGDLGGALFRQGQRLIQGFIDGISDMIGGVGDAIGGVLDFAAGFFPNSPAERGPLSGSGWTKIGKSGGAVMEHWVSGFPRPDLSGRLGGVADVFAGMAGGPTGRGGSAALAGAEGYSGGGGNAPLIGKVTINEAEDPLGTTGRLGTELRRWKARA